jgi:hypothetical protein
MQISFLKAVDAYNNTVLFNPAAIVAIQQDRLPGEEWVQVFCIRMIGDVSFFVKAKDEREALHAIGLSTLQIQK